MVLFIHRPEKYGFIEDEDGNSLLGLAEIILSKHRNGALADIKLKFREELAKFEDYEEDIIGDFPVENDMNGGAMTFGSKMNEEDKSKQNKKGDDIFDLGSNTNFDNEAPF